MTALDILALVLGALGCGFAVHAYRRAARERAGRIHWQDRAVDLSIEKVGAQRRRSTAGKAGRQVQLDHDAARRAAVVDALKNGTKVAA